MSARMAKCRRADREQLLTGRPGMPAGYEVQSWDVNIDDRGYSVVVSRDEIVPGDTRWHVSVAGTHDVPSWGHIAAIVHDVRPGVPFALGLPPRSWWINVAEHCLHAWEVRDDALIGQWRFEARGDRPTWTPMSTGSG